MDDQHSASFDEILEECGDVQLELDDICESCEFLIFEVEMSLHDIAEMLEKVQDHLNQVKKAYSRSTRDSLMKSQEAIGQ